MLVYLATTGTQRLCRRDALMAMFWPEADAERARAALRQALHFIRQEVGEEILVARAADEIGILPGAIEVDAVELSRLSESGQHGDTLSLYGGDFLAQFFIKGAPEFERWVAQERDRLRRRAAESAWALVEARVCTGDMRGAREIAQRAVQLSPDSEVAIRRFIELLAKSGDNVAALSTYRELEAFLAEEYGVKPSQETLTLVRSLATQRATPRAIEIPASDTSISAASLPETTISATPAPQSTRRPSFGLIPLAAGLVFLVSIAGAILQSQRETPRPAMNGDRIAVLPFQVRGGNELRYLHDGLPLLLSTRLDGALKLRTVDTRAILLNQARRGGDSVSLESAADVATQFGAGLYVVGTIVGSQQSLRVEAELHDSQRPGRPIARAQVAGAETELVVLVDRLSAALLADRFRERGGLAAEMAARTSPSFSALKAWLEGESSMAAGRYLPAIASFRAAITADSTFAMAYYRLALAASWAGEVAAIDPAVTRAMALSDHLPPSARSFVQAFYAYRHGRYAEAEEMDRALLSERPASIDVQFDLAELLYHGNPPRGRSIEEARGAFEEVLRADPHSFPAMSHLARLAASRQDTTALDSLTRHALAGDPDGPHRAELLLLRAIELRDAVARRDFAALPPALTQIDALWRAAEYTGGLAVVQEMAEEVLRKTTSDEMRNSLLLFLAHVTLGRERIDVSERYADLLAANAPQYGAVTLALVAQHPAAGAARSRLIARARAALNRVASDQRQGKSPIYAGASRPDNGAPYTVFENAFLSLAVGDSAPARRLRRDSTALKYDYTARVRLQLALVVTDAQRDSAFGAIAALDSTNGQRYATQTILAPRALAQMAISGLLARSGQREAALKRLQTVPEDFGFNVAYLAEVHRRRAVLLRALGKGNDAAREEALAKAVVQ